MRSFGMPKSARVVDVSAQRKFYTYTQTYMQAYEHLIRNSLFLLLDFCTVVAARCRLLLIFVGFQKPHADSALLWLL